jgi:hypothetical protein
MPRASHSAATGASHEDEEPAIFDTAARRLVTQIARRPFSAWYLGHT